MIYSIMKSEDEPPSSLVFKVTPYLERLAGKSAAVKKEFYPSPKENEADGCGCEDPLLEEPNTIVKGLVQKYPKRVLLELTLSCAAYCRFCTRRRKVDDLVQGRLTREDVDEVTKYIKEHKDINEIIFSGGDPLMSPEMLEYGIEKLSGLENVKIIRVHTRVPVVDPGAIDERILDIFRKIKKQAFYLSLHFEHPDEITEEVEEVIGKFRKLGAILLSQSVFLRGVNDSVDVLEKLFNRLTELGVRPYYIYRCDPVKGAMHFMVPFKK